MGIRLRVADKEPIALALKRFKKLLERHGATWELRRRTYFVKPTEFRRAKFLFCPFWSLKQQEPERGAAGSGKAWRVLQRPACSRGLQKPIPPTANALRL